MSEVYRNFANNILVGVSAVTVTSPFGMRGDPQTMHYGIDMTPVTLIKCPADGVVESISTSESGGLTLAIRHGGGHRSVYKHLKLESIAHKVGEFVDKGRILAHGGATGKVTGAHEHYEIHVNGRPVDPLPYLIGTKIIPPYVPKSTDLVTRPELPMFHFQVTSRVRTEPNTLATILGEPAVGSVFPYLGSTAKVDGYNWARLDFNGVIGYCAIAPEWNSISYPIVTPPPFETTVQKEGMVLSVSLKPIVK